MIWLDARRSRYPIIDLSGPEYNNHHRNGFVLLDPNGKQISFHRTKFGALRARRELTNGDDHE